MLPIRFAPIKESLLINQRPQAPQGSIRSDRPAEGPKRKLSVLIVEDDPDNRDLLEAVLRFEGYEVCSAADGVQGERAFDAALPGGFDVVVTDVDLPDGSGLDFAQRLRRKPEAGRFLLMVVTGYEEIVEQQAAFDDDYTAHLVKPVEMERLLGILREFSQPQGWGPPEGPK